MEENEDTKRILFIVESLNQVMCDMVFGYIKKFTIIHLINSAVLSINPQNSPYEFELLIMSYFSKIFFEYYNTIGDNGEST